MLLPTRLLPRTILEHILKYRDGSRESITVGMQRWRIKAGKLKKKYGIVHKQNLQLLIIEKLKKKQSKSKIHEKHF